MKHRGTLSLLVTVGLLLTAFARVAPATTITVSVADGPNEGFNDPTPVAPVLGNPGTTLGEQRRNATEAAARYWEQRLDSDVDIVAEVTFDPLTCLQNGALLGSAGPATVHRDFPGAPLPDTWYVGALANSLSGSDLDPAAPELRARFNSNLDLGSPACLGGAGWDYRIGISTGNPREFYNTVLHELMHGLGFLTLVDSSSGAKLLSRNDAFMVHLADKAIGKSWPDMTNVERALSSVNTGNLVWTGPRTLEESTFLAAGLNTGNPRMFAPSPLQPGSSVSHWDTELFPNELMEPSATATNEDWLTTKAMYDSGWVGNPCGDTTLPFDRWLLFGLDCVPPSGEATVEAVFGDDIDGVYPTEWVVYEFLPDVYEYRLLELGDSLVPGKGYWIKQAVDPEAVVEFDVPANSNRTPSPVSQTSGCASGDTCFEQALVAPEPGELVRYNMVGNPFRTDIALDRLRVKTDGGTCSAGCDLATAEANDIVLATAYLYTAESVDGYTVLTGSGTIPSRAGMWIGALAGSSGLNPRLLFPR